MVRRRLGPAGHLGGARPVAAGRRALDRARADPRHALPPRRCRAPKFFGREAISLLLILPIALPGIITGISLRSAFDLVDIPFSFWTIVLGHATFCIVVVYNNAVARFRRTLRLADRGLDGSRRRRLPDLPLCRCCRNIGTALLAGGMLAFALSFDEVIVTTFTAGQQTTLPIWMLSELIRPRQRPVTNVVAVFVIARDAAADPRRLLPDARRRADRRLGEIAGEPRQGRTIHARHADADRLEVRDGHRSAEKPSSTRKTGETIVKLPEASPAQVDAAVDAAAKAFATWSRTTPAERSALLLKLADAHRGARPRPSPRSKR